MVLDQTASLMTDSWAVPRDDDISIATNDEYLVFEDERTLPIDNTSRYRMASGRDVNSRNQISKTEAATQTTDIEREKLSEEGTFINEHMVRRESLSNAGRMPVGTRVLETDLEQQKDLRFCEPDDLEEGLVKDQNKVHQGIHPLFLVVTWVAAIFITINMLVYTGIHYAYEHEWHIQGKNMLPRAGLGLPKYNSRKKETVQYVRDWFRKSRYHLDEKLTGIETQTKLLVRGRATASCVDEWFERLHAFAPETSPSFIMSFSEKLGFLEYPEIVMHINHLLHERQNATAFLEDSAKCMKKSPALINMACEALRYFPESFHAEAKVAGETEIQSFQETLSKVVLLETLTEAVMQDRGTRRVVGNILKNLQLDQSFALHNGPFLSKHYGTGPLGLSDAFIGSPVFLEASSSLDEKNRIIRSLQTGILEAVKFDIDRGQDDNARIGLALAEGIHFEPETRFHELVWPLGKNWAEAFLAWNVALSSAGSFHDQSSQAWHLLIPSTTCALDSVGGEHLLSTLFFAQGLQMMSLNQPVHSKPTHESAFAMMLARSNLDRVLLSSPSSQAIDAMLYNVCGNGKACLFRWQVSGTFPFSTMNEESYKFLIGLVSWISILFASVGLECFSLVSYHEYKEWGIGHGQKWRLVQYLLPLCAISTIGLAIAGNYMALVFLSLGLWKGGLPEIIGSMYSAFFVMDGRVRTGCSSRAADFLKSIGSSVQYGAISLLICMILTGVIAVTREVLDPLLILILQNCFAPFRSMNKCAYLAILLILEVLFQWSILSTLEGNAQNHWTILQSHATLIVAHWLLLTAVGLELFFGLPTRLKESSQELGERCRALLATDGMAEKPQDSLD